MSIRRVNSNVIAKGLHHISRPTQVGGQILMMLINPSHASRFFLYPLQTSENLQFSGGIERHYWHEIKICFTKTRFNVAIEYIDRGA